MKLQQEEDLNAAAIAGPSSSQASLRQPKATSSAASNIDKPDKKSDNVSYYVCCFLLITFLLI